MRHVLVLKSHFNFKLKNLQVVKEFLHCHKDFNVIYHRYIIAIKTTISIIFLTLRFSNKTSSHVEEIFFSAVEMKNDSKHQ